MRTKRDVMKSLEAMTPAELAAVDAKLADHQRKAAVLKAYSELMEAEGPGALVAVIAELEAEHDAAAEVAELPVEEPEAEPES